MGATVTNHVRRDALRVDLPVEWIGVQSREDEEAGRLQPGHPGRVTDPSWQDVFVEWVGLEDKGVSRWICFDYEALAELSETEYTRRAARVRAGLPPRDD